MQSSGCDPVLDVELLNLEYRFSSVMVQYQKIYQSGRRSVCRKSVKDIGNLFLIRLCLSKSIRHAEFLEKAFCGWLRNDVRLLFKVILSDGSVLLIQEKEHSRDCIKLLNLANTPAPVSPVSPASSAPYKLHNNELPQGTYWIGRDIPPGTYDFFVVRGQGGCFKLAQYDANNQIVDGTYTFYWVGQGESYEQRELIHIYCPEDFQIRIQGNVILRIATSERVKIKL